MGMAASQARYLGLTARKTNVEYEGQQINQARTALANQSANLFNRMLGLQVPVAPKTTDYTEQQYAFSDGYNDYEVDLLQQVDKEIDGQKYNYLVTYHYNQDVYKGIQEKNSNPQVQKISTFNTSEGTEKDVIATKDETKNTYTVTDSAGQNPTVFQPCTDDDLQELKQLAAEGIIKIDDIEEMFKSEDEDGIKTFCKKEDLEAIEQKKATELKYAQTLESDYKYKVGNSPAERYNPNDPVQKAAVEQLRQDFPELNGIADEDLWIYSKNGKTLYATEVELNESMASRSLSNAQTQTPIKEGLDVNFSDIIQVDVPKEENPTKAEKEALTQAKNDYAISSDIDYQKTLNQYYTTTLTEKVTNTEYARLDDVSGTGRYQNIKLESTNTSFSLKSETKTDDAEYENAMQQYNYDVLQYEKELAEINAKTSIIQVQDRTLELRLRQLDTEQKALSTEMEAVKGVIQKNIETTFKTFSS